MRSYTYSEGQWQLYKDTLPPTALDPGYGSEAPAREKWQTFANALTKQGFSTKSSTYSCRFGELKVFARNHETLTATRRANGDTHDFLCILRLGGTYIRIWIAELHDVSLFFTELEAGPNKDAVLEDFLTDSELQKMISRIALLADHLYEGYGSLSVKIDT